MLLRQRTVELPEDVYRRGEYLMSVEEPMRVTFKGSIDLFDRPTYLHRVFRPNGKYMAHLTPTGVRATPVWRLVP